MRYKEQLAELSHAFRQFPSLQQASVSTAFDRDPLAEALFFCYSDTQKALAFAVNNSGLLLCSSSVFPISKAVHMGSGVEFSATVIERGELLQTLNVRTRTKGLVQAFRGQPELGEEIVAFLDNGERCRFLVEMVDMSSQIVKGERELFADDLFAVEYEPSLDLAGGPILTLANELIGVAVGMNDSGLFIARACTTLEGMLATGSLQLPNSTFAVPQEEPHGNAMQLAAPNDAKRCS